MIRLTVSSDLLPIDSFRRVQMTTMSPQTQRSLIQKPNRAQYKKPAKQRQHFSTLPRASPLAKSHFHILHGPIHRLFQVLTCLHSISTGFHRSSPVFAALAGEHLLSDRCMEMQYGGIGHDLSVDEIWRCVQANLPAKM